MELSRHYYFDVVKPILSKNFPELVYAAALIGGGSEITGSDDEMSRDHNWGLRLQLFLNDEDKKKYETLIDGLLRKELPYSFLGYSTHWSDPDLEDHGTQIPEPKEEGEINHKIEIFTVSEFLFNYFKIKSINLSDSEWLMLSEQRLLEITSGEVYEDQVGDLTKTREYFRYYPTNVKQFNIISEWLNISQEIAFVGRTGFVGDNLGSQIITAKLVKLVMKIAFMLEEKYYPYPKWFGSAFDELKISGILKPSLVEAMNARTWQDREKYLAQSYIILVKEQITGGLMKDVDVKPEPYHSRPFTVINTMSVRRALRENLHGELHKLNPPIGSVNQIIQSSDLLTDSALLNKLFSYEMLF